MTYMLGPWGSLTVSKIAVTLCGTFIPLDVAVTPR